MIYRLRFAKQGAEVLDQLAEMEVGGVGALRWALDGAVDPDPRSPEFIAGAGFQVDTCGIPVGAGKNVNAGSSTHFERQGRPVGCLGEGGLLWRSRTSGASSLLAGVAVTRGVPRGWVRMCFHRPVTESCRTPRGSGRICAAVVGLMRSPCAAASSSIQRRAQSERPLSA